MWRVLVRGAAGRCGRGVGSAGSMAGDPEGRHTGTHERYDNVRPTL